MMLARTRWFLLAAAPALLLAVPGHALAQTRCISSATAQSSSLTDAQKEEIGRCVERQRAELAGEDPKAVQRARDELERPLLEQGVSIAFRIEFTKQLLPVLNDLVKNQSAREIAAVNALHLAGELATPAASDLLEQGLADKRPAVRYAAAYGMKRAFEQIAAASPVFQASDAEKVIRALGRQIAAEQEPHVLEGYARAMDAAAAIPDAKLRNVRVTAAQTLAVEMGKRAQGAAGKLEIGPALIRAGQVLRDTMNNPQEPRLPDAVLKEIAAYGGDLLTVVCRTMKMPGAAQDLGELAAIAATGENAVFFATSNLGRSQEQDPTLVQSVRKGDVAGYTKALERITGPRGVLTQPPLGLPANRFECK